jgi:tetratricopeptide (TPR) repeat protein
MRRNRIMKICPFISHMLGDENHNTLSLGEKTTESGRADTSDDDVILGHDDHSNGGGEAAEANRLPEGVQLECLRESCRFYQTNSEECRFDLMLSKIDGFEPLTADTPPELARDIDKIWKFQTQGVSEIVESLADSDKKQAENLENLKSDLTDRLGRLEPSGDDSAVESIRDEVASLQKKISEMEEWLPKESTIREIIEKAGEKTDEGLKSLDVAEPVKSLEQKVDDILSRQKDYVEELAGKLEAAADSQKGVEDRIESWKTDIVDRVLDLASRQEDWEKRINELVDQQKELADYLEEGKRYREDEQTRSTKKESKKYNNLGVTSFHNGAFEMARDQFLQAVKMDPDFAEAYNNLGLAYTELDEEEKATEAFTKAVELNSSLHAAYNNLGYIFYKKGDYEHAVEMYNEALGKNNKNGPAYTNLGNAYYRMDRLDEARNAWTKALELDPGNEKAKRNLQRISEEAK